MNTAEDKTPPGVSDTDNSIGTAARRDALKKLGLLAALTPPAMLTLMLSKRASAESLPTPP